MHDKPSVLHPKPNDSNSLSPSFFLPVFPASAIVERGLAVVAHLRLHHLMLHRRGAVGCTRLPSQLGTSRKQTTWDELP